MEVLLNSCYRVFSLIYTSGIFLWDFFSTPLSEQSGIPEEILGFFSGSLLELMLGAGLIFALIYALVSFFIPL